MKFRILEDDWENETYLASKENSRVRIELIGHLLTFKKSLSQNMWKEFVDRKKNVN